MGLVVAVRTKRDAGPRAVALLGPEYVVDIEEADV
jgi:hypothetical protein